MELMTREIAAKLIENDHEVVKTGECSDIVVVKYFNPCGPHTWHIVSGTPVDADGEPDYDTDSPHDWHLFGFCNLGDDMNAELGYLMLSDLQGIDLMGGLGIERDLYLPDNTSLKAVQDSVKKYA